MEWSRGGFDRRYKVKEKGKRRGSHKGCLYRTESMDVECSRSEAVSTNDVERENYLTNLMKRSVLLNRRSERVHPVQG